jgi:nucleoside-diphosphate-sugar epimerase
MTGVYGGDEMEKTERVLVTGGAGFIGSWLCRRLLEEGYKVICVDNLSSGRKANIDRLDVEFIRHDVREPLELEVDFVFHLASRASPQDFPKHPLDILSTNSLGTYNMLKLAKEKGARFLLASSSEVYGDPLQHPQSERYWGNVNPIGLRSCYDESKRFSEALAMAFCRKEGVNVRIARIFNTYGEGMREKDGRVIPTFINQALADKPVTVYGDGSQTRSFCYVADMVDGLMRLMFSENLEGEVINLGNPSEMSILRLAELITELTDSKSRIVFEPLLQDDPVRRRPDIAKAKQKLGWQPKVKLEDGLKRVIDYFRVSR